jgi:hypothetical protein
MELEDLKSDWKRISTIQKPDVDFKKMLKEGTNPALKRIRKQILIELGGWLAFMMVYYTAFDGDKKPLYANLVLIIATIAPIFSHLYGYKISKYLPNKADLKTTLKALITKMKIYSYLSIFSRIVYMLGLLYFFIFTINLTTYKYQMVALIGIIFLGQLWILWHINQKAIHRLHNLLTEFDS